MVVREVCSPGVHPRVESVEACHSMAHKVIQQPLMVLPLRAHPSGESSDRERSALLSLHVGEAPARNSQQPLGVLLAVALALVLAFQHPLGAFPAHSSEPWPRVLHHPLQHPLGAHPARSSEPWLRALKNVAATSESTP